MVFRLLFDRYASGIVKTPSAARPTPAPNKPAGRADVETIGAQGEDKADGADAPGQPAAEEGEVLAKKDAAEG